jgi:hypothetical protein
MDVYSTELGIRLSFFKTSEFRGRGVWTPPNPPFSVPLFLMNLLLPACTLCSHALATMYASWCFAYVHVVVRCYVGGLACGIHQNNKAVSGSVWTQSEIVLLSFGRCQGLLILQSIWKVASCSQVFGSVNGFRLTGNYLNKVHLIVHNNHWYRIIQSSTTMCTYCIYLTYIVQKVTVDRPGGGCVAETCSVVLLSWVFHRIVHS